MRLYRALDAVMPAFRQVFSEFGLTEQQWRVLRVLWEQGSVPLSSLASATLIGLNSTLQFNQNLTLDFLFERCALFRPLPLELSTHLRNGVGHHFRLLLTLVV